MAVPRCVFLCAFVFGLFFLGESPNIFQLILWVLRISDGTRARRQGKIASLSFSVWFPAHGTEPALQRTNTRVWMMWDFALAYLVNYAGQILKIHTISTHTQTNIERTHTHTHTLAQLHTHTHTLTYNYTKLHHTHTHAYNTNRTHDRCLIQHIVLSLPSVVLRKQFWSTVTDPTASQVSMSVKEWVQSTFQSLCCVHCKGSPSVFLCFCFCFCLCFCRQISWV